VGMFDFAHGQTGAAPNQIELHPVIDICFPGSAISGCSTASDFALGASPAAVTTATGGLATSTLSVTGSGSFAGNVALSVAGTPTGATATLSSSSVAAGGTSTLTLTAGSAAPGTYTVTVTGASGALSHAASISWTITGSTTTSLVNGDFEVGTLTGWTSTGSTSVLTTGAHGGTHVARVGSTAPTGDSTIRQTVTLPSGSPQLSFFYKMSCPDTITFDWATVTITTTSGTLLATPLAEVCEIDTDYVQVTADLSAFAGQRVVLTFANHDDNFAGDPTFTLFDDITITGGAQTADFVLSVSASAVTSAGGAAATTTITAVPVGGFASPIALSVTPPAGASAAFSPTSIAGGSGSSTLTLSPGAASNGSYALTITASGGGLSHSASVAWTIGAASPPISTVFLIVMENHNWSSIKGSASAPYINNTLLAMGAHAENYVNVSGIHPSEPNYLWLEAGTNFGIANDNNPSSNHQSTTRHLVTLLQNAGVSWRSYQEGISGTTCPLTATGLYAPKHNPMIFFDDISNTNSTSSATCISHVRPYTELAGDLTSSAVARYNFITPNLCHDMHNSTGCATTDAVRNGDTWLSTEVPKILASSAYQNGGALFITWDESEGGDVPIGMIVLSPKAKAGFSNTITYDHSSTLRTVQTIFGVTPLLGGAASATDLRDLFQSFP
jgi:phosphatidylinositol-3-phosphatase